MKVTVEFRPGCRLLLRGRLMKPGDRIEVDESMALNLVRRNLVFRVR